MVRHDPRNERGPTPPRGRIQTPPVQEVPRTLFELRPRAEYELLWRAAVNGARKSLDILAGYSRLRLPVNVMKDLVQLRDHLDTLIQQEEARNE